MKAETSKQRVDRLWDENIDYVVRLCEGISKQYFRYSLQEVLSLAYPQFEKALENIDEDRATTRPFIRRVVMNAFKSELRRDMRHASREVDMLDRPLSQEGAEHGSIVDVVPDFRVCEDAALQVELKDEIEHLPQDEKELLKTLLDGTTLETADRLIRGELRRKMQAKGWELRKFWEVSRRLAARRLTNGLPVWVSITRQSVFNSL